MAGVDASAMWELVSSLQGLNGDGSSGSTEQATCTRVDNDGTVWVRLLGAEIDTPVNGQRLADVVIGDNVTVTIEDGLLSVIGNSSRPSTSASHVEEVVGPVVQRVTEVVNVVADKASVGELQAATARIGELEADHVAVEDLTAVTGRIQSLESDHVSVADFQAEQANIDTLQANTADIDTIRANSAKVQNLTAAQLEADHATVGTLDTTYATIANLNAANGRITNLESTKANISDLEADYITADEIEATYMHANMSNSDVAWIENGTIKNGAIVSAMINDVSANKLTAGTINGSVINVTNLNADNITTGTINGQRIGTGSLSLDKLADDVYTETEVNNIVDGLNDRIDGAIETHTGTAVPTLNNSPASSWNTTKLRDEHVGDVYYVVNSQSQQNGYCYRFTKSGSTYSWQLIKDSDVTAALSRLTTAEGKITTFDSDISTLKTDTGTLTTRTTNLETRMSDAEDDILDKVDTTTFNEVSDTVDAHSQTISQHTTALSNKADNSTVTAVTNRVTKTEQDISGINTTIGQLQTTVESKADGSTVTTISNKLNTVSDTVDGHTQNITSLQNTVSQKADGSTVSTLQSDYATFKQQTTQFESTIGTRVTTVENEFDNLEIGGRNLLFLTRDFKAKSGSTTGGYLSAVSLETRIPIVSETYKGLAVRRFMTSGIDASTYYDLCYSSLLIPISGNSYVFSFYAKGSGKVRTHFYPNNSGGTYKNAGSQGQSNTATDGNTDFTVSSDWQRFWVRFEIGGTQGTNARHAILRTFGGNDIYVCGLKFEDGTKATGWSPAPEDIDSRVDEAESSITQNATNINAKVSKNDVINQINLSTEGVLIDADRVEINGAAVFSAIKSSTDAAYDAKGAAATVQTNLDNIEVGGRNLLRDTDILRTGGSYWAFAGGNTITVTTNSSDPDGGNNATLVTVSGAADHYIAYRVQPITELGWYTFSIWMKASAAHNLRLTLENNGEYRKTCAITTSWQRFDMSFDIATLSTTNYLIIGGYSSWTGATPNIYFYHPKLEKGNKATDWTPAPEDLLAEEQYIYTSSASGTTSINKNTTWVTQSSDVQNVWTTKRPTYNSSYPVLFVAKQSKTVGGSVNCTTPVKDDTTTVIDGAHITTGTIDTNRLNADTIKSNIVQTTNLSATQITSGDISADRIKANVIGAINSLTAGQIDAARINASQLTIGQSQVTNLTSDFAHKSDVTWTGTCDTAAGTAAKEVVCDGFTASELTMGATICVRFNAANTSSAAITLNVNGTGAKPISVATGATSATNQLLWASGATIRFMYNTSLGQWRVADTTPTYYSTCSVGEGVAAKTAGCAGCVIFKGVAIHIIMTAANTNTSATLNVNSTGAKAIYYGNTTTRPTTANEYGWKAGATASFVFDGAYWRYADASAMYQSADAAKTASNYITTIDATNGIKIANASPSSATTYLQLASTFLDFIRGGVSMLKAWVDGTTAKVRVGAEQIDGTDTFNTLTDNEGIKLRRGTTVLSQFATNLIELGKNSYNATISLLNNGIEIYATDIDPDHRVHFGKITSGDSYLQFAPWSTVEGDESAYSASAKFGVKHEFTSTRGFGVDDSVNIGGDGFVGLTTALVDSDDVPLAEAGMYAATNMGAGNSEIAIIGDKVFLYDGGGNTSTYYGPFPMSDVASAIPVTLYDNASASASAAATLSETAANFKRLTIFFKDTDGNYSSTEVWSPNGKRVALSLTWINGASTQNMYQRVRWVTISGTTISTYKGSSDTKYRTGQVKLGATASVANSDYISIVHVIGYR